MDYVKTTDLNLEQTFFHFTRIDNRNSIERNGLVSVAGGENKVGGDSQNPTIYFSYGADGLLKTIDVWIKWEYNRLRKQMSFPYSPTEEISEELMHKTYEKVYEDFKNRNYYSLDLIEGDNPKTSDFSFSGIDKKKQHEYNRFLQMMEQFQKGQIKWIPNYPSKDMAWMYGSYSNFNNGNISQENWNMNTHIGNRVIPNTRIKIIEGKTGKTDGLSIAFEMYDTYRQNLGNIDLSRLDDFIQYARGKIKNDPDYSQGSTDIGRRSVDLSAERKYGIINQINTQRLGEQVVSEMSDIRLEDETERTQNLHQQYLEQTAQKA